MQRYYFFENTPPSRLQRAGDAGRHQIHERDQEHAVDRPGRRFRDVIGDVGDELDEHGAEDRARDRGKPADHDADQERDRKEEAEAVGRHEADRQRAQRAADAGIERAHPEGERLVERRIHAHRGGRGRMIADGDQRAADAAAQDAEPHQEHCERHREREQIEPLVRANGQAERRRRLEDDDPLHPAGPFLDALVFEQLGRRDREREGGEREIEPFEPQRRQPEQEARDQANEAGGRKGRPVRKIPTVHHDRRDIGADRKESAVAERDLAVVAGEDVEPQQHDRVTDHERELERPVVADK